MPSKIPYIAWDGECDIQDDGDTLRIAIRRNNETTWVGKAVLYQLLFAIVLTVIIVPGLPEVPIMAIKGEWGAFAFWLPFATFLTLLCTSYWLTIIGVFYGHEILTVTREGIKYSLQWRLFRTMTEYHASGRNGYIPSKKISNVAARTHPMRYDRHSKGMQTMARSQEEGRRLRGIKPMHGYGGPFLRIDIGWDRLEVFTSLGSEKEMRQIAELIRTRLGLEEPKGASSPES